MARTTPLVRDNTLYDTHQPEPIPLSSPAWQAWLMDAAHCSFHFQHPSGEFTARKERKQRGSMYWVAYRQAHNVLCKRYLGRSDALTEERLIAVGAALAAACAAVPAQPDP
jgi:LuxR family transcriptional regulator, maltose regulon positive regulatory protein